MTQRVDGCTIYKTPVSDRHRLTPSRYRRARPSSVRAPETRAVTSCPAWAGPPAKTVPSPKSQVPSLRGDTAGPAHSTTPTAPSTAGPPGPCPGSRQSTPHSQTAFRTWQSHCALCYYQDKQVGNISLWRHNSSTIFFPQNSDDTFTARHSPAPW